MNWIRRLSNNWVNLCAMRLVQPMTEVEGRTIYKGLFLAFISCIFSSFHSRPLPTQIVCGSLASARKHWNIYFFRPKNTPNVTSVMFFVTNTNQKHHHRDDDEIGTKLGGCWVGSRELADQLIFDSQGWMMG